MWVERKLIKHVKFSGYNEIVVDFFLAREKNNQYINPMKKFFAHKSQAPVTETMKLYHTLQKSKCIQVYIYTYIGTQ